MSIPMVSDEDKRTVEIQISNDSRNITLTNPRIHFRYGYSCCPPRPSMRPGSQDSCKFSNSSLEGCEGILTYEAESFTMAIYFFNPVDYYMDPITLGLEISLEKSHLHVKPADIVTQMASRRFVTYRVSASHRVTVDESQEAAQVSAGQVRVMATMSNDRNAIIKVVVEE